MTGRYAERVTEMRVEIPDDLAAKITIHYYLDARDALFKAIAV